LSLWIFIVYAPVCHWLWGGGFLFQWGAVDFAGGIVVHTAGAFSALACLLVLGRREGASEDSRPHNVPFAALGLALIWFAEFGLNSGSALAAGSQAVIATANSEIAGSAGLCTWVIIDWALYGRPNLTGLCHGAIAGLSMVAASAGFIQPPMALILGIIAGPLCYACSVLLEKLNIDDALHVWGVQGAGGFIGSVLLGVAADPEECQDRKHPPSWCACPGVVTRSWMQVGKQLGATCCVAVYAFVISWVLLQAIDLVLPLRPKVEIVGLSMDLYEHGQEAYRSEGMLPHAPSDSDSPPTPTTAALRNARYYVRKQRVNSSPLDDPISSTR